MPTVLTPASILCQCEFSPAQECCHGQGIVFIELLPKHLVLDNWNVRRWRKSITGDNSRMVGKLEVGIDSLFTCGLPATLIFSVASGQGIYAAKVRTHARMCVRRSRYGRPVFKLNAGVLRSPLLKGKFIPKATGQSSLFLVVSFSKQPLKLRKGLKAPQFGLVFEFFRRVSFC